MILDSMLHNSPAATVLLPFLALAAYAVAQVARACLRRLRGPGSHSR